MITEQRAIERIREIARNWGSQRLERPDDFQTYEWQQLQHWFYCLVFVLGIERNQNEPIGRFLDRVAEWRDIRMLPVSSSGHPEVMHDQ